MSRNIVTKGLERKNWSVKVITKEDGDLLPHTKSGDTTNYPIQSADQFTKALCHAYRLSPSNQASHTIFDHPISLK